MSCSAIQGVRCRSTFFSLNCNFDCVISLERPSLHMNSLRWWCSSSLTQKQDRFLCKIITTEIDSHFISNSTRETQQSHFTRSQRSTFGKEEVQDMACTSIYLMETLSVMLWLRLWPQRMSVPSQPVAHHTGCFTSPAQFATNGAVRFQEVAEAPAKSPRRRTSVCKGQRGISLLAEHPACPPASTWANRRGWLGPTPCRNVVTLW